MGVVCGNVAWPGTQLWYQPSGLEGPNVVVDESDIQPLINLSLQGIRGGGKLVIDGSFSGGVVALTQPISLISSFDVEFVACREVTLALPSGESLFLDPKQTIDSESQVRVTRLNSNGVNFARTDNVDSGSVYKFRNIIWDPVAFSTSNVGFFYRNSSGAKQAWFEDCSLNAALNTSRAEDRWFQVVDEAPTELLVRWFGPNAGRLQDSTSLAQTALTGWNTEVSYGTFGGPALTMATISWAAAAPTVVNRQP